MTKAKIEPGTLLIAQPFMMDQSFRRSVILICDHSPEDGTIGFVMNKGIDMTIEDLIADFPEFDAPVSYGGPVGTDTIHYIHDIGHLLDDSIEVCKGVYWGGDFEKLKILIDKKLVLPKNIRFFVGYSGWSEGQLMDELEYGSWLTSELDPNYAFQSENSTLWQQVLDHKGERYTVISRMPENFNLN